MPLSIAHTKAMDIHKVRYFTSVITISEGKVKNVSEPSISSCPVASRLYGSLGIHGSRPKTELKSAIRDIIEKKIRQFGFFTDKRVLDHDGSAIPYGASEVLSYALKKGSIDSCVMVCDGAGTVIARDPDMAQGIGARMNTLLYTSPIHGVIKRLRLRGCEVVFDDADIDQVSGIAYAAKMGHKKIAVTINAYRGERLRDIRQAERRYKVSVAILVICTTGITTRRVEEIAKYADIVWGCNSDKIRARFGKSALARLSSLSPVYVLTQKGVNLASGYRPNIYSMRKEMRRS